MLVGAERPGWTDVIRAGLYGAVSEGSGGGAGKKRVWRVVQILISIALVAGIFVFAIPKLADYSTVWAAIKRMTSLEIAILVGATVFNLFTYWWQVAAWMPSTLANPAMPATTPLRRSYFFARYR
jgi:Kef-type K+ transport system membrane component KefB